MGLEGETHVFKQDLCFHQPNGINYLVSFNPINLFLRPHLLWKTAQPLKKFSRALVAYYRGQYHVAPDRVKSMSFGEFLRSIPLSEQEISGLLVPIMHMFFGVDFETVLDLPADYVVRHNYEHKFFHHSTLHACRAWNKGTATYINRLAQVIKGVIHTGVDVRKVERISDGKTRVLIAGSEARVFDAVLIATPPAAAYKILAQPTTLEARVLSPWESGTFKRVIHQDVSVLPKSKAARGFWNPYTIPGEKRCGASYVIKKMQPDVADDLVVSWDPIQPINPGKILETSYAQGVPYTQKAIEQYPELPKLNEQAHGIYYCGAHFKFGWHESGVHSALDAVARIQEDFLGSQSELGQRA